MKKKRKSATNIQVTQPERTDTALTDNGATQEPHFFVVGVGASAGGLDAISSLLENLSLDHMAFVVVQHLSPHHESNLPEILGRSSNIKVVTAEDGMELKANCVYVAPPGVIVEMAHRTLQVRAHTGPRSPKLPIDTFLYALAQSEGPYSIGIILSGTGSDGTFGLQAIKAAGGVTLVQDPESAQFDGMPRSALATGDVDFIMTPRLMARKLLQLSDQSRRIRPEKIDSSERTTQQLVNVLFSLFNREFGNDLSFYKTTTIERRINRRMAMHQLFTLSEYVRYVQSTPQELAALYKDMLITVTSFFRDPESFDTLKDKVLPYLFAGKGLHRGYILRVWVPACATGEEAYSLAMAIFEYMDAQNIAARLQIFATDVDHAAIEQARRGEYPTNISQHVSPERLRRFFIQSNSCYRVSRRVRESIVFSAHNLLRDPPFSRIQLVSCRNLLIYLKPETQKKCLHFLHYALSPGGCLQLGSSESVGDALDVFSLLDKKSKVFCKRQYATTKAPKMQSGQAISPELSRVAPVPNRKVALVEHVDKKILEMFGPAAAVVNEKAEILHFRGSPGSFLGPVAGAASLSLLKLVRRELRVVTQRLLNQTFATDRPMSANVKYPGQNATVTVSVDVLPIVDPHDQMRCCIVAFREHIEVAPVRTKKITGAGTSPKTVNRLREVEAELANTRDYLQTIMEEKESVAEEMQSSVEEMQSANEEMQSINEELETSKEEMESTNEELTTVNDELTGRMRELRQANDDLHNVLSGVDNPVIVINKDYRITRFTTAAESLLGLTREDKGRSVTLIDRFLGHTDLLAQVAEVIETLETVEQYILCSNLRWYLLRVRPYKTLDNIVQGVVISLIDRHVQRQAEEMQEDIVRYANKFLGSADEAFIALDSSFHITWANAHFYRRFQLAPEEVVGSPLSSRSTGTLHESLRTVLKLALLENRPFADFVTEPEFFRSMKSRLRLGGRQILLNLKQRAILITVAIIEDSAEQQEDPHE